jgi:hypothetical protein
VLIRTSLGRIYTGIEMRWKLVQKKEAKWQLSNIIYQKLKLHCDLPFSCLVTAHLCSRSRDHSGVNSAEARTRTRPQLLL